MIAPRARGAVVVALLGVFVAAHPGGALHAHPTPAAGPPDVDHGLWRAEWRKSDWYDGTTTLVLGGSAAAMQLFIKPPDDPHWTGPILFDQAFRDLLAAGTRAGRADAAATSNILWYSTMVYPLLDTLVTALAVHQDSEAAWEMFAMTTQAYAVTGFFSALFVSTAGRARPLVDRCQTDSDYSGLCGGVEENRSFASGHASFAFTGAGLTCAFHSEMDLYGDGPWGTVACIGTLVGAATNGVLRMVSDRHWVSDVLVGSGVGFAAGYLLPKLLHFDYNDGGPNVVVTPWTSGDAFGLGMSGTL